MSGEQRSPQRWARVYSLGIDLAAAVGGLSLLGYWIDRHYQTDPWGILIGFGLGLVGGMYNFIRSSIREYRATMVDGADGKPAPKDNGSAPKP